MVCSFNTTVETIVQKQRAARLLRWHKKDRKKDAMLRHPADGSQWRKIEREFPDFADDARNLRFGLSTDAWILLGSRAAVIAPGMWLYVSITFLFSCAWSRSSLWCQCSSKPEATWQRHWCVPKAISWRTFTVVVWRRCTCVGWAQIGGIWPTSVVVRNH